MFSRLKPLPSGVIIRHADWAMDEHGIAAIRREVFIDEQAVPEAMEWETIDSKCDWFVAQSGDGLVAITRLTPIGRVGRMAVLDAWRGQGIGSALLARVLDAAMQSGLTELELHAQCHAVSFYQGFGFIEIGPEFEEAGIPHKQMKLRLQGN
jgi:predicted GNAT family N-acyltransferase